MAQKKQSRGEQATKRSTTAKGTVRLYTLDVALLEAAHANHCAEVNPRWSRTLQLRGDQTLADLHRAIDDAFGCQGEQVFEFQFGKEPLDPEGPRYVLPGAYEISVEDGTPAAGRVDQTSLDALSLQTGRRFMSWTDDDCWHEVIVAKIEEKVPRGHYPKITHRVGENPSDPAVPAETNEKQNGSVGNSEAADAACLVGELHLSKGDFRKAVEAFSRAIEENATADAYEGRAKAYRGLADEDEETAQKLR